MLSRPHSYSSQFFQPHRKQASKQAINQSINQSRPSHALTHICIMWVLTEFDNLPCALTAWLAGFLDSWTPGSRTVGLLDDRQLPVLPCTPVRRRRRDYSSSSNPAALCDTLCKQSATASARISNHRAPAPKTTVHRQSSRNGFLLPDSPPPATTYYYPGNHCATDLCATKTSSVLPVRRPTTRDPRPKTHR